MQYMVFEKKGVFIVTIVGSDKERRAMAKLGFKVAEFASVREIVEAGIAKGLGYSGGSLCSR